MLRTILLIASLFFSSSALAEYYVFASVLSRAELDVPPDDSTTSVLLVGGGYRLNRWNRHFAGELAYFNPGKFEDSRTTAQGGGTVNSMRTWEATGPALVGVGSLPLGRFASVFLRGGIYLLETEVTTQETLNLTVTRKDTVKHRRASPSLGVGAGFTVDKFMLRAFVEQVDGGADFNRLRITTLQLGVSF